MTPDNIYNEMVYHHYDKSNTIKRNTFVIVTVLLSVALLLTSVGWLTSTQDNEGYRNRLENMYLESYHDLLDGINDIEISLDKLSISTTHAYQVDTLEDIHLKSSMLVSALSRLSIYDQTTSNTTKYLNQVGDYSYYLATRLTRDGDTLTTSEKSSLSSLGEVSTSIGMALREYRDSIQAGEYLLDYSAGGGYADAFDNVDSSIDYPTLIYDGPFSDARQNKTPLGIVGEEISSEEGLYIATTLLPSRYREELSYSGEMHTLYDSYLYTTPTGDVSVSLTTTGQVISMDIPYEEGSKDLSTDECIEIASSYLEEIGYKSMREVWCSIYYGTAYINYVYESDGVLIYPDMVKVKVSTSTGEVIGVECMSYIFSHVSRDIPRPTLDEEDIMLSIPDMQNVSIRLCIVPVDSAEVLCYEVYGEIEDYKYFIYYDALTGMEINILKVIDSEDGELLL